MLAMCRVLFVVALGVGFVGAPTARADDKKPEKPNKSQPAAEPAKTIIIQIDASKLPPDVLKQLLQLAEKPGDKPKPTVTTEPVKPGTKPGTEPVKPGTKPGTEPVKPGTKPGTEPVKPGAKPAQAISLAEAIAIAEKTTQGTAVKAERKAEDGVVQFKVEVQGAKGGGAKLTLDASGKVTNTERKEGDKDEDKGKKKKKDD